MNVTQSNFGTYEDESIQKFILKNNKGMEVHLINYGATITSIKVPFPNGEIKEITCGFDSFENYFSETYKNNAPYFGGTVGRYCSQIKDAKFQMNGEEFNIAPNCGDNNLHGGNVGFDKRIWKAQAFTSPEGTEVKMKLKSKDMEEGFPGDVKVSVTFLLTNENELKISYKAKSDKDTPFTITNHTYFNLSGFNTSVEEHKVQIKAGKKLEMDDSGACTGKIIDLDGKADDLRAEKQVGKVHTAINDGFEHYYIFDKDNFELENVATIKSPESGLQMEVATSEPGMLFYTGKYTSDDLKRESGLEYGKYRGFCCETHRYPNGPNINGPKSILKAGEKFESTTVFKFS